MKSSIKKNKKILAMNKYIRLILIILSITALIGGSCLLYFTKNQKKFTEAKVPVYSYKSNGKINYSVFLIPNIVYTQKNLEEGKIYITDYVDYINASFKYEFSGERPAEIKGEYEIVAIFEGLLASEKESKTVWKREFVLQPKTSFNVNDKTLSIQKDIPLKLKAYNDFIEKVIKTSNVNFDTKCTVTFRINLEAKTDKGLIKENISPTMEIPLNTKFFEIKGNLSQGKPSAIEETIKTPVPVNKKIIVLCYGLIVISIIALIFLLIFTANRADDSLLKKKLKRIFKMHGDRLVALNSELTITYDNLIKVSSIEDLVRISDDICKPILYVNNSNFTSILNFYVVDENKVYLFEL